MRKSILYIVVVFFGGCTLITEPETPNPYNARYVLDDTINLIKNNYPFISFKKINTDSLYTFYLSKISNYEGDKIYNLLYDILDALKDGHVWFYNPNGYEIKPHTPRRSIKDAYSFSLKIVEEYLKSDFHSLENGKIIYGKLNDNIGYVFIKTFLRDNFNYQKFTEVINNLWDTKGIIIDVRSNGGGSDLVSYYVLSHFIKEPFLSPIWLDRNGNELGHNYIQPIQNYYSKPVILLQNGTCFSSTEGFICMMRELENVTTLGDTTAGGSGAPVDFTISYDIKIHLSRYAQLTYQREYIEWNGLKPDILVPQSRSNLENKKDIQLEAAINILNKN